MELRYIAYLIYVHLYFYLLTWLKVQFFVTLLMQLVPIKLQELNNLQLRFYSLKMRKNVSWYILVFLFF